MVGGWTESEVTLKAMVSKLQGGEAVLGTEVDRLYTLERHLATQVATLGDCETTLKQQVRFCDTISPRVCHGWGQIPNQDDSVSRLITRFTGKGTPFPFLYVRVLGKTGDAIPWPIGVHILQNTVNAGSGSVLPTILYNKARCMRRHINKLQHMAPCTCYILIWLNDE